MFLCTLLEYYSNMMHCKFNSNLLVLNYCCNYKANTCITQTKHYIFINGFILEAILYARQVWIIYRPRNVNNSLKKCAYNLTSKSGHKILPVPPLKKNQSWFTIKKYRPIAIKKETSVPRPDRSLPHRAPLE